MVQRKRGGKNKSNMWRKRRVMRKRAGKPRNSLVVNRRYDLGTFSATTLGDISYALKFQLSSLPNSTDFTNLFDMYQIRKVKVIMTPIQGLVNVSGNNAYKIYTAIDYNDDSAPTDNMMRQYGNFRQHNIWNDRGFCSRTFKPTVVDTILNNDGSVAYSQSKPAPWISTQYPVVPHYCLKIYGNGFQAATAVFKVDVELTVALKNVI